MPLFTLASPVVLNPQTTTGLYVTGIALDKDSGVMSWVVYDNPNYTGRGKAYSAQLTGPQLATVATIIKNTMSADLGVAVT